MRKKSLKDFLRIRIDSKESDSYFSLDHQISIFLISIAVVINTIAELQITVSSSDYFNWILIKFFSLFLWYFLVLFSNKIYEILKIRNTNYLIIGASGSIIGLIVGTYIYYSGKLFEIQLLDTTWISRSLSTMLFGAVWFPIGARLTMDRMHLPELKIDDFGVPQNKIRENFSKSRTYRNFIYSQSENIKNELKKITERIVKNLSEESDKDGLRVENILKELESGEIRNLSIKITDLNFIKFNPSKIRIFIFSMRNYISTLSSLTFNSMKLNKVDGNIFAFLILVAYAGFEIRLQKLDQISILFYGFIVFIVTRLCVFLVNQIHDKAKINFFKSSFIIYIVNIFILIYIGINLSNLNFTGSINFSNLNIAFSLFFLYISVFVLNHLIQAGVISSNDILSFRKILILNQNIEREMLWEQYLLIGTRWSVHIHGKVQTRISAAALAIKQDLLKDNQLGIKSTIHKLIDLLKSSEIYLANLNRNLEEEIDARLAPWSGIVEIDTVIDEGIADSESEWVGVVGEVIEEVISNAVRHGGATEIRIEVRPVSKSTLLIYSEDNSPQLPPEDLNIKRGIGSTIFSSASLGNWKLSRDKKRAKTVFQLRMKID